jgi:hypothetical protein
MPEIWTILPQNPPFLATKLAGILQEAAKEVELTSA